MGNGGYTTIQIQHHKVNHRTTDLLIMFAFVEMVKKV